MVKDMIGVGILGNFTNNSLRATGTTTLFDAGVPEVLMQKSSGHKSSQSYKQVTPEQNLAILNPT